MHMNRHHVVHALTFRFGLEQDQQLGMMKALYPVLVLSVTWLREIVKADEIFEAGKVDCVKEK